MTLTQTFKKLVLTDLKLISRDGFLLMMFGFMIGIALMLRFALPALDAHFQASGIMPGPYIDQPLSNFFPLLIGFLSVFQGTLLAGAIYGFLLLDEKEDQTLVAMQVTPLKVSHFIGVRLVSPALFSFLAVLMMFYIIGMHIPAFHQAVAIAFAGCFTAPIAALFYAIFAQNKLQGFGMAKFIGVAGWVILIAWFVPQPYDWILGIFTPFFATKAYWMALDGDPNWWIAILVGIIAQSAVIFVMLKMLRRTLEKLV